MPKRFVEFCSDGILRVSMSDIMIPVSSLCNPDEGMPWWLSTLPVVIGDQLSLRSAISCLDHWKSSIFKETGFDIKLWNNILRWDIQTPQLTLFLERHIEIGSEITWFSYMRGLGSEDMGNPDEMPLDILGRSNISINNKVLAVAYSEDGLPILDAGHKNVFSLSPSGIMNTLATWTNYSSPTFADFVNNCLLTKCIPQNNINTDQEILTKSLNQREISFF